MANKHSVTDDGDLRKYYAAIPKLVLQLGLNPYELALYVHFKEAAGDKGGVCWKSRATIAKESMMSVGMVTKARAALEAPRPEFNGRPLISVTEEPSKTGGKPTCRITITDIWAVNMSKFSTSPHDGATSYSDGEALATSYHDSQRHTVTLSTSPHALKEEPFKKNKEEEQPTAHVRLMDFLSSKIGPIPNGAKEGKAVKWLLANGYDPVQCEACFGYLAGQDWRTSSITWTTVKAEIGGWLAKSGTNGNGHSKRLTSDVARNPTDDGSPRPQLPAPCVSDEELRLLGVQA